MRMLKVILIICVLGGLAVPLLGCGSESDQEKLTENQVVTVERGNLILDINAVGNLALSRTEDLAFEIASTVEEVLVEEGDTVKEGDVLATLDTSAWEDNIEELEGKLTTAERQLTSANRSLTSKERDLIQADINVKNAQIAYNEARDIYTWPEITVAQDEVDNAKAFLEYVLDRGLPDATRRYAETRLSAAESTLDAKINTYDTEEVIVKELQLTLVELKMEDARTAVEDARIAVEDAQKDVADAQEALEEALDTQVKITAPFDGFITMVNVEGGDEVFKGTVAVQLADPEKFEADILVSEMDIMSVKLGGTARVQVDAMPGLSLPAKITHIAPTATIQSGVVNYQVKVEIASPEAVMPERQEARQDVSSGELPERLKQAVTEGRLTQEQAEEMITRRQSEPGGQSSQVTTTIPEDFQLREGLTVTVSIVVDERHDVLLVPNTAITAQGSQAFVNVLAADGTLEKRAIQTGISDFKYTEVIEGLAEGEQITVPEVNNTVSTGSTGSSSSPMRIFGRPH